MVGKKNFCYFHEKNQENIVGNFSEHSAMLWRYFSRLVNIFNLIIKRAQWTWQTLYHNIHINTGNNIFIRIIFLDENKKIIQLLIEVDSCKKDVNTELKLALCLWDSIQNCSIFLVIPVSHVNVIIFLIFHYPNY